MSPFNTVDYLTVDKVPWEQLSPADKKSFAPFMVNRILSMNKDLVDIVNLVQINHNIPPEYVYKLYLNILPKARLNAKYIKKSKDTGNKQLHQILAAHWKTSTRDVKRRLENLHKDVPGRILTGLGYDEKEIKKLLK